MRKIIVLSMITLDGVMQSPGGPREDPSGGFNYGGWVEPYGDETFSRVVHEELNTPADYLLGRKTYQIWAGYWPEHGDFWPGINQGTKYVFSKKLKKKSPIVTGWKNSVVIRNLGEIKKLRSQRRSGSKSEVIQVWGSGKLIQLLLKNNLVDELKLKIFPLMLGKGKKLFGNGVIPAAFTLTESMVTTRGVIIASYKRAGKVRTGTIEP